MGEVREVGGLENCLRFYIIMICDVKQEAGFFVGLRTRIIGCPEMSGGARPTQGGNEKSYVWLNCQRRSTPKYETLSTKH